MEDIGVHYIAALNRGRFSRESSSASGIWSRVVAFVQATDNGVHITRDSIELPWSAALDTLREFDRFQHELGFRFVPTLEARERIEAFARDFRAARSIVAAQVLAPEEIAPRLVAKGWDIDKRTLKEHQAVGLIKLASWHH